MIDLELKLCADKSLASAITSDSVDFGQKTPDSGMWDEQLYVVIGFPTAGSGAGTVTFCVQESADDSTFTTCVSTAAITGTDLNKPIALALPLQHKRYIRLKTSVSSTVAGKCDAFIADKATLPMNVKKDGIDVVPTVDDQSS